MAGFTVKYRGSTHGTNERVSQEGREKAAVLLRRQHLEGRKRQLERKREIFEARMTMLRAEFEVDEEVIQQSISESTLLTAELLRTAAR